jgi:hypothetical protein
MLLDWIRPSYDFCFNFSKLLVADIPDERMAAQPVEGRVMNHPAFLLGHLAWANDNLLAVLGETPQLANLKDVYGMGSRVTAERARYAPKAELLAWHEQGHRGLLAAVQAATAETLAKPAPDRMRTRFPTVGTFLAALMDVALREPPRATFGVAAGDGVPACPLTVVLRERP